MVQSGLSAQLDVSGETVSLWIGKRLAAGFEYVRHTEDKLLLVFDCILV